MPHRLSSRKEPPAPTYQPSRATFCIRRTQDAIYKCIAPFSDPSTAHESETRNGHPNICVSGTGQAATNHPNSKK